VFSEKKKKLVYWSFNSRKHVALLHAVTLGS